MAENICIYHGNCLDGFAAAWVVWDHCRRGKMEIEFHAGIYRKEPPDVKDKSVVIVDFSYPRNVMLQIAADAHEVIILDHHKSAKEDLIGIDKINGVFVDFDMDKSGCMLAWDHFNPFMPVPKLLDYIQDYDLWRFNLDDTKEINAALASHEYDFEMWNRLIKDRTYLMDLRMEGRGILRKMHKEIDEYIAVGLQQGNINGYTVPVINLPYFYKNEAAEKLCKGKPFAAVYYLLKNSVGFSLRSDKNGVDVSQVARYFGGGGHKHAAGFSISYSRFLTWAPELT